MTIVRDRDLGREHDSDHGSSNQAEEGFPPAFKVGAVLFFVLLIVVPP